MMAIKTTVTMDSSKLDSMVRSANILGAVTCRGIAWKIVLGCRRRSRVDTGDMKSGWRHEPAGEGKFKGWRIFNDVPYTIYNEFGTWKMAAKPMLRPSFEEQKMKLPAELIKYMTLSATTLLISPLGGG